MFSFYTSKDEAAVLAVERWKIGHLYAEDSWPQRLLENKDGGIKSGMRKACRWSMFHRQLGVLSSRFCPRLL